MGSLQNLEPVRIVLGQDVAVSGCEVDWQFRQAPAQPLGERDPAHPRHHLVREHDVEARTGRADLFEASSALTAQVVS